MRLPLATLLVAAALVAPSEGFTWPAWPRAALGTLLHPPAGRPVPAGPHTGHYTVADYVREFGREYSDAERPWREALVAERLAAIEAHNAGQHAYKQGANQFTDRTEQELRALGGARPSGGEAGVFGAEGPGLTEQALAACDGMVEIPMPSHMNSLNVAVATGVFLYEAVRQRG